jgi:hypothetical protein
MPSITEMMSSTWFELVVIASIVRITSPTTVLPRMAAAMAAAQRGDSSNE